MLKLRIVILVFAVSCLNQPCFGISGVPDLFQSEASLTYDGPGTASLMVVPDGSGNSFTEAHDEQGNMVDATITLYLRDSQGVQIVAYPFEDLWLESANDGLVFCLGGTTADYITDNQGMTQWVTPLHAGGYSQCPCQVIVSGSALTSNPGLPLRFNSPDINGDLTVNLQDVSILALDFFRGADNFRSDLTGDGVLNLQDIPIFAQHLGALCP